MRYCSQPLPARVPRGFYNAPVKECSSTSMPISRYQKKISAPLRPYRLHLEVPHVDYENLADKRNVQDSKTIRAYHRVLKLARTIADLAGSDMIMANHVAEAMQYRPRVGM